MHQDIVDRYLWSGDQSRPDKPRGLQAERHMAPVSLVHLREVTNVVFSTLIFPNTRLDRIL